MPAEIVPYNLSAFATSMWVAVVVPDNKPAFATSMWVKWHGRIHFVCRLHWFVINVVNHFRRPEKQIRQSLLENTSYVRSLRVRRRLVYVLFMRVWTDSAADLFFLASLSIWQKLVSDLLFLIHCTHIGICFRIFDLSFLVWSPILKSNWSRSIAHDNGHSLKIRRKILQ